MSAIEVMLEKARRHLDRVSPADLATFVAEGALLVDIRPSENRSREGEMPGAVVIERNVLEWRLDATGPDAIDAADPGRHVIIVCNEGYASSLAAHVLRQLGIVNATDLEGGYRAWRELFPPENG